MAATNPSVLSRARLRPLTRALAAMFLIAEGTTHAATVTNCKDSGTGSLRWAVANTSSGGTVDMSNLSASDTGCQQSRISLTTGAIKVTQNILTIAGPGTDFNVTGKYYNGTSSHIENARLFNHTGNGRLTLENFALRFGYYTSPSDSSANGGCVYSQDGEVSLVGMDVTHCRVTSPVYAASGGAVAAHSVRVLRSTLESNSAVGGQYQAGFAPAGGYGGAIAVLGGSLYMKYGNISGNETSGYRSFGGAISSVGAYAYIRNSTISSNLIVSSSEFGAGGSGIDVFQIGNDYGAMIVVNSTITGNLGGNAAFEAANSRLSIYNSTIAFNEGYGLVFSPNLVPGNLSLNSVILSNNASAQFGPGDLYSDTTVTGAHNLVYASENVLPPDTITGKCPLLAPLRDNGGPTGTLMLHSGSPAIDAGNNLRTDVSVDQRGSGFPRGSGPPDIGAYEVQQDDIVFNAAFEGC